GRTAAPEAARAERDQGEKGERDDPGQPQRGQVERAGQGQLPGGEVGEPEEPGAAAGVGEPEEPGASAGLGEPEEPGASAGLGEPEEPDQGCSPGVSVGYLPWEPAGSGRAGPPRASSGQEAARSARASAAAVRSASVGSASENPARWYRPSSRWAASGSAPVRRSTVVVCAVGVCAGRRGAPERSAASSIATHAAMTASRGGPAARRCRSAWLPPSRSVGRSGSAVPVSTWEEPGSDCRGRRA